MKRFQSISENLSYNDILQLDGAFSALHINYGKSPLFNGENSKDLAKNSRKNSVSSLEHVEDVFEYMTHFNGVENDFKKGRSYCVMGKILVRIYKCIRASYRSTAKVSDYCIYGKASN